MFPQRGLKPEWRKRSFGDVEFVQLNDESLVGAFAVVRLLPKANQKPARDLEAYMVIFSDSTFRYDRTSGRVDLWDSTQHKFQRVDKRATRSLDYYVNGAVKIFADRAANRKSQN